ncbi:MAG TPA: GNAT family N-acetyltransferase [Ktedonobacterales bacterium]|nr:GNAT family N-acetyltransferase [Ktedonobacterales bacterium]
MAITYRRATVDDIPGLARLRWEMEVEHKKQQAALEAYAAVFETSVRGPLTAGTQVSWLAEADGDEGEAQPVACVTLIWWDMPPNFENAHRRRGFVSSVYTRPEYRRQGISRQLMQMLIAWAREHGLLRLILRASDMGRPLYSELGFAPSRGMELDL